MSETSFYRITWKTSAVLVAVALSWQLAAEEGRAQSFSELSEDVRDYVSVPGPNVALTGVKLIDGTGSAPRDDVTILVREGRIARIGPAEEVRIPSGAEVLDLEGHTVLPGFVGLHQHLFYPGEYGRVPLPYSAPRLYLAAGVTTARTGGAYVPYGELNLMRQIDAGEGVGPAIIAHGPYLNGIVDNWYQYAVRSPEDAREVVAHWAERGATWFKVDSDISRAALEAVIQEAHIHGAKVTGHLCSVTFTEAVALGIDNLEHGYHTNAGFLDDKEPDRCPEDAYPRLADLDMSSPHVDSVLRLLVDNDVALTSTLAITEAIIPGEPTLEARVLRAMESGNREAYLEDHRRAIAEDADPDSSTWGKFLRKEMLFQKRFAEAGGLLAAGADPTGSGGALPGFGDQRNYELLVTAGFDPAEAVEIMTLNGARVLGLEDRIGSVETGKDADLIVLRGSLAEDASVIRAVRIVFKKGVGFDPQSLMRSVDGMIGAH